MSSGRVVTAGERARNERISASPEGRHGGDGDGVKVAESISPAIIGSAGTRKTPLINTSSRALDNLRPRSRCTCATLFARNTVPGYNITP